MQYTSKYKSPLGGILLAADETGLTGLWFEGQKYFALHLDKENEEKELPVFEQARKWLDIYFSGKEPDFKLSLHFTGSVFQNEVWEILYQIPYGQTTTYGTIAKQLAKKKGLTRMSAQAVGGAVAHNEISIIVPCHRVVGGNGSLTGYAGGIDKKIALLKMEKGYKDTFFVPQKSTAPWEHALEIEGGRKRNQENRLHLITVSDGEERIIHERKVTFFDIHSSKAKQFGFTMGLGDGERLTCCGDEPYHACEEKYARGSKWLLHEAFCLHSQADIFRPYEKHHSTVKDACELAEGLGVKNLLLYHTEDRNIQDRKKLYIEEGQKFYSGKIWVPEDLQTIDI